MGRRAGRGYCLQLCACRQRGKVEFKRCRWGCASMQLNPAALQPSPNLTLVAGCIPTPSPSGSSPLGSRTLRVAGLRRWAGHVPPRH